MNSINSTSFSLTGYHLDKERNMASFKLHNPGPGDTYGMQLRVVDDGVWHRCEGSLPWQLVECQYMLDKEERFGLGLKWECDDRDPSNA